MAWMLECVPSVPESWRWAQGNKSPIGERFSSHPALDSSYRSAQKRAPALYHILATA